MWWVKTPGWLQFLFPKMVWKVKVNTRQIYLTFDDGPTPEVTLQVLDLLFRYKARATFFCIGEKADLYPDLIEKIRDGGHVVANHGYTHFNGLFSGTGKFFRNVQKGAASTKSNLFRPPYGRITPWQVSLLGNHTRVIQWSIMSMDFCLGIGSENCLKNVTNNVFPGAIIVFHDSLQAANTLREVLPKALDFFLKEGYSFGTFDNS